MDWPELTEARDGATMATLHRFTQVAGKLAVALLPWRNHGWHLALHVHPRGLRTETLYAPSGAFEVGFDLLDHAFTLSDGTGERRLPLAGLSVARFHHAALSLLQEAGHPVRIHGAPNEVEPATPFASDDAQRAYEPASAQRLLGALLTADRLLELFRSGFLGKASPVHFFWGSFDLAVTRFSGRRAPRHPGGIPHLPDDITREAYSHEVSSAGFWPAKPLFYSYAYPAPEGFAQARVEPASARFDPQLGEFVLDYAAARAAPDPDAAVLAFLQTTYEAAARLGGWDRASLECALGRPRVPRQVDSVATQQ